MSSDYAELARVIAANGCGLGAPLHLVAETESTNDDAKAGARAGAPHGAIWVAEKQLRGRGRNGRTWVSPAGESLLFTVVLRLACPPSNVPPVSLACGLAVRDAVAKAVGDDDRVLVKWPNDVMIRRREDGKLRKVAGILVESALSGSKVEFVVVGVGVNVHTQRFDSDLTEIATSIALEQSLAPDRATLLADILAGLAHDIEHVAHRGLGFVHARLAAHDALRGLDVDADDGSLSGVACGIAADGRLLVQTRDGAAQMISSGEVRLRVRS